MPKNIVSIPIQEVATFHSDRKNQFNSKQIIQILQPIIIDFRLIFCLQLVFTAGAGFSNNPGKYVNVVFIIKNPGNRNKRFQK